MKPTLTSTPAWVRRGCLEGRLSGVTLVISDVHAGLKSAAVATPGATWPRCRVHFMRNALAHVPRKQRQMVAAAVRTAFEQEGQAQARDSGVRRRTSYVSAFPSSAY